MKKISRQNFELSAYREKRDQKDFAKDNRE